MFITVIMTRDYSEKMKLDTWLKRTQTNPILPAVALAKAGLPAYVAGKIALSDLW
jgi:hypothetical protein